MPASLIIISAIIASFSLRASTDSSATTARLSFHAFNIISRAIQEWLQYLQCTYSTGTT